MKNFYVIVLFAIVFSVNNMFSQSVSINTDGSNADASSILDVKATDKGVLVPRVSLTDVTSASPVSSPASGLLVYNTNATVTGGHGVGFYVWNGSSWIKLVQDNDGAFIRNQNTTDQTANFRITGIGRANTSFQSPIYTRADAGTVAIRPHTDATTAIQLQNAVGTPILNVDATNSRVGVGITAPTSLTHIVETGNDAAVSGLLIQESNAGQALTIEESGNGTAILVTANDNGSGIISTTQGAVTGNVVGTILNETRTSSTANLIKVGLDVASTGNWNGANAQNIGLRVNVSGGTNNYSALFNGGNVGVNTAAPIARLQSTANPGQDAIAGLSDNNTGVVGIDFGNGDGVYGQANGTLGYGVVGFTPSGTGQTIGVLGESASTSGFGMLGLATATTGANVGVQGQTASTSGIGTVGIATTTTGATRGVIGQSNSNAGIGVLGNATSTTGSVVGVQGQTASTSGFGTVGIATATTGATRGVIGQSNSNAGIGTLGNAISTTGATRGVLGSTESASVNSHGVLGQKLGNANGTGYLWTSTQAGVVGYSEYGNNFRAGVQGATWSNDPGNRTSGVIGIFQNATGTWGALAYKLSNNTTAAVYGTAAYASGAGFSNSSQISGVGIAGYGGVIGSWTRGEVMGHVSAGELFASYNLGDVYTSGYNAEIIELENERVAVYTMTGTDVKIYNDGTSALSQGRKRIEFDSEFSQLIGDNIPVITVSPMGACNGLYVTNISSKGFEVVELANGTSNVEFSYILISKRKDSNNKSSLPKDLAKKDFDANMKGVMFNESNLEQSAKPIWWDGANVRFDEIPMVPNPSSKKQDLETGDLKLNLIVNELEINSALRATTPANNTQTENLGTDAKSFEINEVKDRKIKSLKEKYEKSVEN